MKMAIHLRYKVRMFYCQMMAKIVAVVDMVNHHPEILEYLVDMAIVVVMSGVVHCLRDLVAVQS